MTSSPPRPAMTSSPEVPTSTSSPSVPTIVAGNSTSPPHVTPWARAPGANWIRDATATATTAHATTSLRFIHIIPLPCIGRAVMEATPGRIRKVDIRRLRVAGFRNPFTRMTDNGTGGSCGPSGPSHPSRAHARSDGSGFGRVPDLVRGARPETGDGRRNGPKPRQEAPHGGNYPAVGGSPEPALERRGRNQRMDRRRSGRCGGWFDPGNPAPHWPRHHRQFSRAVRGGGPSVCRRKLRLEASRSDPKARASGDRWNRPGPIPRVQNSLLGLRLAGLEGALS